MEIFSISCCIGSGGKKNVGNGGEVIVIVLMATILVGEGGVLDMYGVK